MDHSEPFVHLLETDLLAVDSAQKLCSSRQLVFGAAVSILNLCGQSLLDRFEKMGADAFDPLYLISQCDDTQDPSRGILGIAPDERRLFSSIGPLASACAGSETDSPGHGTFSGSTEFFFLTGALLRVSLFPSLRIHQVFMRRYGDLFSRMRDLASKPANEQQRIPHAFLDQVRPLTDVSIGWTTFLEDSSFIAMVTSFSLLQLRWLVALSQDKENTQRCHLRGTDAFAVIPEWLCKLPAQWLAHVATRHPQLLKPYQADAAVEVATRLLQVSSLVGSTTLSPPVLTELIRIAGAFVRAGVQRALQKVKIQELKQRRGMMNRRSMEDDAVNDEVDERWLEIYLSFDAKDLGITVFANKYMLNNLCPTLISTFSALDAVEGMDVEREHDFDKFGVKFEVAELLLRLWSHPGGEPRLSIVALNKEVVSTFASSVAAALGLSLDNALQQVRDVRSIIMKTDSGMPLPPRDQQYFEAIAKRIAGGMQQARRYLVLLCQFSGDDRIAATLGGCAHRFPVSQDLATMFVQFLDKLTAEDGGTHPELDFRRSDIPTSMLVHQAPDMTAEKISKATSELVAARSFVQTEFGFDVSLLIHQFLALAARWHLAAKKNTLDGDRRSDFLKALVVNQDFSLKHLHAAVSRLVTTQNGDDVPDLELFERDGHLELNLLEKRKRYDIGAKKTVRDRARRWHIKQEQMTHSQLWNVASKKDVAAFIEDLGHAIEALPPSIGCDVPEEEFNNLECALLQPSTYLESGDYSDRLEEFVVSSESFLSSSGGGYCFSHTYDSVARARSNNSIGAGKIMVKEARKCKRGLPRPHPNASTFVCFAEERMDLCRAIVVGAVDTPYSLGLFEFDVFFPAMYPTAPPLLTFKTTGGGQVRFNPNLYNDGKVCISLLGTAHAWNESQRWNAEKSSLAQVLLSVQSQILAVPDPFFNEGFGHEAMKGTEAGEEGSRRYNNSLRLATLRYAIIAYLKFPPQGFEEVVKRHFSMCRKCILVQARRWTLEAKETPLYKRFVRAYRELVVLLSAEDLVKESESVLPPLQEDVEALMQLDPSFVDGGAAHLVDRKPAAKEEQEFTDGAAHVPVPDIAAEPNVNPWAHVTPLGNVRTHEGSNSLQQAASDEEVDDEDDFYS